jgi:hypothetical protein
MLSGLTLTGGPLAQKKSGIALLRNDPAKILLTKPVLPRFWNRQCRFWISQKRGGHILLQNFVFRLSAQLPQGQITIMSKEYASEEPKTKSRL